MFLYIVGNFRVNLDERQMEFVLHVPILVILANYDASGKILILPIQGNGASNITFGKIIKDLRK